MREVAAPSLAKLNAIRQQIQLQQVPEDEHQLEETAEMVADRRLAPIVRQNAELNRSLRLHAADFFIHRTRIGIVTDPETNYERIFRDPNLALSRRSVRVGLPDPEFEPGFDGMDVLRQWYTLCIAYPRREDDEMLIDGLGYFNPRSDARFLRYLPERLRWYDMRLLISEVRKLVDARVNQGGEIVEWEPLMGNGQRRKSKDRKSGRPCEVFPFLGVAAPGRLVWKPHQGWRVADDDLVLAARYEEIRGQLLVAERAVVALARRIAGWIAWKIVYDFVVPEQCRQGGREILGRQQITRAVREILGENWFHLPCDLDGSLRAWSVDGILGNGAGIDVSEDGQGTHLIPNRLLRGRVTAT